MKHKLDLQTVTLDFWINRLLMEKYGIRLSARISGNEINIYWNKGNCLKANWIWLCKGKLKAEIELPNKKELNKLIAEKEAKK